MTEKYKILVVDDHRVVRDGVVNSLASYFPGTRFDEAANAAETLRHINEIEYDLVLLDISMPGRSGLEVLKEIKAIRPGIPVIVLSMYPEEQFGVRSIKDGASAYLTKDISVKKLAEAIRIILKGERYLTPTLMDLITDELQQNSGEPDHRMLSDREYQVFLLIAGGKNVSSIARELSLSVKTISVYRSIILKKLSLKNNSEIIYYAFSHNLVV